MIVGEIPVGTTRELDKTWLDCECEVCKKAFQIKYGSWRRDKDNTGKRCFDCNQSYRHSLINNLPEEERKAFYDKRNKAIQHAWLNRSDEAKEATSQKRIAMWANRSEEEMDQIRKHRSGVWAKRDPKMKERIFDALHKGREEYLENLTQYAAQLKYLEIALSHNQNRSMGKELTQNPNPLEIELIHKFQANGIKHIYSWYSTKLHPEFNETFEGKDPAMVTNINPYHKWDFLIETTTEKILVDLDGTIHGPNTAGIVTLWNDEKCSLKESTAFKDSQRPYQTDGLKSYIIKAYDGKLSDDVEVFGLHDNSTTKLSVFLTTLSWMCKSEAERKQLIKDTRK